MVTINFLLTKEDYFNFNFYTSWLSPGKKMAIIKSRVKTFILFIFSLSMVTLAGPRKAFDSVYFFSIFMLAAIYVLPLLSIKTNSRKLAFTFIQNRLNAHLLTQTEVVISPNGIFSKNIFCEVKYKWECIIKKEETNDYYFLYINSAQALIIPKRVLRSAAEKEALAKLLSQHISFDAEMGHLIKP